MSSRFDFRLWGCIFSLLELVYPVLGKKKKKEKRRKRGERVQSVTNIPCISSVFCPDMEEGRPG